MTVQIGVVKAVIGEAIATSVDGSERTLRLGDNTFSNDLITTGTGGAIEIWLADGSVVDLGRDSQIMLNSEFFYPNATLIAETEANEVLAAISSHTFLFDETGDAILSGREDMAVLDRVDSDTPPLFFPIDSRDVVDVADVFGYPASSLAGVASAGHVQIQLSNEQGVVHLFDLTGVAAMDNMAAQRVLDDLLNAGKGEDTLI